MFWIFEKNIQMILPQTFYFLTCWWGQCFDGKSKKSKRVPFEKWTPDWLSLYLVFCWYNFPEERQKQFNKTFYKPIFQTFLVIRQIAPQINHCQRPKVVLLKKVNLNFFCYVKAQFCWGLFLRRYFYFQIFQHQMDLSISVSFEQSQEKKL